MRKFTLLLLFMYVTTSIAQVQDGVYKLFWRDDNRGYLTYHETDYPAEAKLSGVTYSGCESLHYASDDTGIKTLWYLITSDLGFRYIFEVTTGKFISIGAQDGDYITNKLSTDTPCPITIETPVNKLNTQNEATPLSYQLRAVGNNGTIYRLCSGCGTNKEGHPVRWLSSNFDDGGFPLTFVQEGTATVSDDILNAAKATITRYEKDLADVLALAKSKLEEAAFSYNNDGDYLDLVGKATSNADQNTGGGSTDGQGIAALVDGDDTTYFHTRWGGTVVNEPHYWQIDLGENNGLSLFSFYYKTRNATGSPVPTEIVVSGSDNETGTFTELAVLNENMPNYSTASGEYNSPVISSQQSYRYLRFTVTRSAGPGDERRSKQYFFGLAEFKIRPVTVNVGNEEYADKVSQLDILQTAVTNSVENKITITSAIEDLNAKLKPILNYITDLTQLSNTSVYTITPANTASTGVICAKEDDLTKLYITHRSGATVNLSDPYQQFAIFEYKGYYFLYNVGAQKFVKKSGSGTALTDDVTAENEFVFEASNATPDAGHNYVQADYPWCIVFEGMPLCATAADTYSGNGGVVTNWDHNGDSGTVLSIAEVDTDVASLAEAYAKVQEFVTPATTITYKYMFNGSQIASENIETNVGLDYPTPTNVPDGYSAATPTGTVEANAVIEINLVFVGIPITDLTQLSNTSVYTITPANTASTGAICAKEDDLTKLYITHRSGATVNLSDPYQQFAIFEYEDHYFLYNVGAQKFVKKSESGTALTDDVTAENEFVFEASNATPDAGHNYVQADYPWCIVFEGMPLCATAADAYSGNGGVVTNWDHNGDSGTVLSIAEVDTDVASLAEAYAKVQEYYNAATTVTYKYMLNDAEVKSVNIETTVGYDYPAPVDVPIGYTAATPEGKVTANAVVEINLTFTGYPFEYSETVEGIEHWYYMQMHSNNKKYIQYIDGENKLEWQDATLTPEEEDLYTWAFVGTPEQGFKIVNLALGTDYALNSNGSGNPSMGAFETAVNWIPANSTQTGNAGYFCLKYPNGNYMNAQSASVAFWSTADAGSTILLTERTVNIAERTISVNVIAEGVDVAGGNVTIKGKVGTSAKFASGSNATVVATANNKSIFKEWQKDGNVVSTDAEYTFTVDGETALTAIFVPKLEQTCIFDFTFNDWSIPTITQTEYNEGVKTVGTYNDGTYTVTLNPTANSGNFYYDTAGALRMAKNGTKLSLPAFTFDVEKIEVVGHVNAKDYQNADMNVFVNGEAVSAECQGSTGTNVFEIAESAQAAGNVYELVIGDKGGDYSSVIYISYIKVYPKVGLEAPVFDVENGVYTQPFTVNIVSSTASMENVTNVKYYYVESGDIPSVEYNETDGAIDINKTCTIGAMVQLDYYGITYTSEVNYAEYIISDYVVAQRLYEPKEGSIFIVANGNTALRYDVNNNDKLSVTPVDKNGDCIKTAEYYSYTLETADAGYFLKDGSGSYLAASGMNITTPSFLTTKTIAETNTSMYTWTVTIDDNGAATISNNGFMLVYDNNEFVLRSDVGTATLPSIYGHVSENIAVRLNDVEDSKLISGFEKSGLATFSAPFSTTLPEGVTAYYALEEDVKAEYVSLVKYSGTELPAMEGFILVGEPGEITMTISNNVIEGFNGANKLGNTAKAPKVLSPGECYLLAKGTDGAGFYACSGGTLAQYKSYLNIATGASRSIVIRFPGATGIENVNGEAGEIESIYDLTGRKIEEITTPGVYIVNGKKVLVK